MIAADVDNNRSITTIDMIRLRRLILGVDQVFVNNTSWRFVDAAFKFPDPTNPWLTPFPEVINYNNLADHVLSGDFIAVKVGDVTLDAKANALMSQSRNSAGAFTVDVPEKALQPGVIYRIPFQAQDAVAGYQFTLSLDPSLELLDITYGIAEKEHFGMQLPQEGMITTSWNGAPESGTLFELVLQAKAPVQLSEVLKITSRITRAEAYNSKGELLDVALRFIPDVPIQATLYQNRPNPFLDQTSIGFWLPEAGGATLTIRDITGKVLRVIRDVYSAGYNEVRLYSDELHATGVLYYTLETNNFTGTKKMIITR
jgi:hypothetical protein